MTNGEFKVELEKRTVAFSVLVLKMLRKIPVGIESRNIKDQVARSVTAIGANYREANRAESRDDFLHKIAIVANTGCCFFASFIPKSPRSALL